MSLGNLLLVDDETDFLSTLTKRLAKRKFNITTANNGNEAMEKLRNDNNIETVVLDVKMPGKDGIQVLKEIKKEFPLTEVIMLTGHGTIETAIEGMKLGAFDYLIKPCDMDVFIEKVSQALSKKRQHEDKIVEARLKEITSRRP